MVSTKMQAIDDKPTHNDDMPNQPLIGRPRPMMPAASHARAVACGGYSCSPQPPHETGTAGVAFAARHHETERLHVGQRYISSN